MIGALAVSSLVILVSNSFNGSKKVIFQALLFSAGLAASLSYLLITNPNELKSFWTAFIKLSQETKFSIAIIAITTTYFGAAMYIAPPEEDEKESSVVGIITTCLL